MNSVPIVLGYLVLQMTVVWLAYRLLNNPSVVDSAWSIGLMNAGLIYLGSTSWTLRSIVIAVLLVLWALRLAGYLWYTRILQGHIDQRYTELSSQWKINPSLGFFLNFQLQGGLIFLISLVFHWITQDAPTQLTWIDCVAIGIVAVGIAGESIADYQLHRFKQNRTHGVCAVGLWQYSRHPNYFFDWVTWLGFTVFAVQSSQGYFGVFSLGVLYLIFTQITGPLTERRSVASRGQQYLDYQQQTSMFFPWFKFH